MKKAIGKIGLLIPEITDSLDFEVLDGMYTQAKTLGYDLLLFTGVYNIHTDRGYNDYHRGLDNIYALPAMAELDALILAGDRFKSEDIIQAIDARITQLSIPKLVLNHPMKGYINVYPEQAEHMYRITKHLIEAHHCRKIYCMAGIKGEVATIERLAGFRRAMDEAKLSCSDSAIFYGQFWRDIPYQIGKDIGNGSIIRPDAVVCQSDIMAVALIKGLQECGLSVPEDVAVTGYDGNWVSNYYDITTISGRDTELGAAAVAKVHQLLTGQKVPIPDTMQKICYQKSCGCQTAERILASEGSFFKKFSKNMMLQYYYRKEHITADFMTKVTTADSPESLICLIQASKDMIYTAEEIDICLCEDWKIDFSDAEHYRREGYSDSMISVLTADLLRFPTEKLLPRLMAEHEPTLTVFTSLFCRNQILGYTAVSFREASDICIDEYFVNWSDAIANGFRVVQEKQYREYVQREIALHTTHDPNTGLLNKKGLLEQAEVFTAETKRYSVLLISYRETDSIAAEAGFAPYQLLANAIRLTSDKNELYARLDERIFCILISLEREQSIRTVSEARMLRIEKEIRYMHGTMKNLFRAELVYDEAVLAGCDVMYLDTLLIKRMQVLNNKLCGSVQAGNTVKEQLYQLRHEIMLKPEQEWNIKKIAARLGISTSYLQHLYKAEFSVSCFDDVILARIEKAKHFLTETDLRMTEIAEQCGYQSNRHFTRQFGQYVGVSPTEYRKNNIQGD